jgi:hypothetical protein
MARWTEFAVQAPEMAALGSRILSKYGLAYLGTVRPDGGPRVHPLCPVIVGEGVYVGIIPTSPKRRDLDRDGRFVLHGLPGPQEAEFCFRGRARRLSESDVVALRHQAPEHVQIADETAFYELDIHEAICTTYRRDQGSRPVPMRTVWTAEGEAR